MAIATAPMQHHHHHRDDPLAPDRMQMFLAGLSGLPADEIRKAKSLYLRNAISEYNAAMEGQDAFRSMQGCISIIPLFWPILHMQKRMLKAQKKLFEDRIRNAMEVWADDLEGETFDFVPRHWS